MSDGEKMLKQRENGDTLAASVLSLYDLHRKCPSDPGAYGLFIAAYSEWKKRQAESTR